MNKKSILEILANHPDLSKEKIIPILQDIQDEYGFLPEEQLKEIAKQLKMPISKIFGVATFYNQFRFSPRGQNHIRICKGTACHLSHTGRLISEIEKLLRIRQGQITSNGMFSFDIVDCIGACSLAPVIAVNEEFYTKVTPDTLKEIIETYKNSD